VPARVARLCDADEPGAGDRALDWRAISTALADAPPQTSDLNEPGHCSSSSPLTVQAPANAMVRASKWIQGAGPGDIINAVPENYLLGDRTVYIDAFLTAKGAKSPDGMIPDKGADTSLRALAILGSEPQGGRSRSAFHAPGLSFPQVQQQAERNRTPDRRAAGVDREIAHLGAAPPSISLTAAAKTPSTARTGRRSTGQRPRTTHILGAPR
jgi:hypothetical protein